MFGGVPVAPGDLIMGDDDGLVVIPRADIEAQLQAALQMVLSQEFAQLGLVYNSPGASEGGEPTVIDFKGEPF